MTAATNSSLPAIRGLADIERIERIPLDEQNDVWTVYELMARGAAIDPDKAAFEFLEHGSLEDEPQVISYRELMQRVHQAANLFHSLGVGKGDVVAILLPILPQNFYALLGAITAGIAFPINWMLQPEQIAALLRASGAKVLVALGPTPGFDIWDKAQQVRSLVPGLGKVLQVKGPGGSSDAAHDFDLHCAACNGNALETGRVIDAADVALYVHTGGTTGLPKIAQLVHRAIAYKCWAYKILLAQAPEQCGFAANPLFHIGGIIHHTISWLARGMRNVILGPMGFRSKNVIRDYWKLVERYRVTELGGVPTTLGVLAGVAVNADISSLRPYVMTGSAGLPIQVSRYLQERIGVRILNNYGMTENTATIALPPRDGDPRFGSSGIRFPFTRIRTVKIDDAGRILRDCNVDEIGEILVHGPGVTPGYLDPSLNQKLFIDGNWLRTGDLGRLDADSYLWVTGRAKDVIIRGGHNIDPQVIEETLMAHPTVALVAAVGKPDAHAGELPIAYVQLKPGASADAIELKEFARTHIPERAAAPVEVLLVDTMPLTAVGKIFRPDLRVSAAKQVFTELVATIATAHHHAAVDIASHPVHGTMVTVALTANGDGRDRDVEAQLREAFDRYTYAYEIRWRGAGDSA